MSTSTAITQRLGIADSISFQVQYGTVSVVSWNHLWSIRIRCPFRKVPLQNLIPNSYPKLNCKFTRETNNNDHRLPLHCADETGIILWPIRRFKDCISVEDMIQSLIAEKEEWWRWFCDRELFLRPSCVPDHRNFN
jgi:hypothetical protein